MHLQKYEEFSLKKKRIRTTTLGFRPASSIWACSLEAHTILEAQGPPVMWALKPRPANVFPVQALTLESRKLYWWDRKKLVVLTAPYNSPFVPGNKQRRNLTPTR